MGEVRAEEACVGEVRALAARRVHVDLWAATWLDAGAAASSVRRRALVAADTGTQALRTD